MITWLDVPFAEKDAAKALGARWSPVNKRWFVENVPNISTFMRWIPAYLKKPTKTPPKKKAPPVRDTPPFLLKMQPE